MKGCIGQLDLWNADEPGAACPAPATSGTPAADGCTTTLTADELNRYWESPSLQKSLISFTVTLSNQFNLPIQESRTDLMLAAWRALGRWSPDGGADVTSWCYRKMSYQAQELRRENAKAYHRDRFEKDIWTEFYETSDPFDIDDEDVEPDTESQIEFNFD